MGMGEVFKSEKGNTEIVFLKGEGRELGTG